MEETFTKSYPVMEHFATIQGEGFHSGTAAYFIRLGGCDVGCHWCDVKESWPMDTHPMMQVKDLIQAVKKSGLKTVVITGGEPSMYDLKPLTQGLRSQGLATHIETSGTNDLTGTWDWVTFSPKKFKAPVSSIYQAANELKVVIYHKSDFAFAEEHRANMSGNCALFLQPEWDKRENAMVMIVDYIHAHTDWRVSLQTHKYLSIP